VSDSIAIFFHLLNFDRIPFDSTAGGAGKRAAPAGSRQNQPLVDVPGTATTTDATRTPRVSRVDTVEWAASAVRARLAGALPSPRRRRRDHDGEALVARASDHARRRVHAAAREAHAEWSDGGDVAGAMHRLGSALSVAAEFDA
jgi:hypothetical protein